jgi:hypothetical protein
VAAPVVARHDLVGRAGHVVGRSVTRRSYYGPDPDWWPVIAEALPRPWSREAIMHDLCWWADQERVGRRARPGRPALCARWGVTGHAARTLMRDEDAWGDPAHRRQPTASESPADRQPTAVDQHDRIDLPTRL